MIRPALPGDAPACTALVAAAYTPWIARIGRAPGPMLDDMAARIAAGQCWVLDDEGIAGLVVLEAKPDGLWLDNVAVARPGRGIGRQLIDFAEAEAQRRGYDRLRLYTHVLMTENRALYARLGYVETALFTEAGFERVAMEKRFS
ncbi:GNAT family N-acetyltransferase [Humitalea sp. 24SJ18S-53]|uniref:GNAT family N-acetyltransferase n=1 Tax=Humitalea sp. 24SJ18S-53 TaxID=3422307 RepID=UPI003D67CEE0